MDSQERKETIQAVLMLLKSALIQTESSMALCEDKLVFFGTEEYIKKGSISKCDGFSVKIEDLVK